MDVYLLKGLVPSISELKYVFSRALIFFGNSSPFRTSVLS